MLSSERSPVPFGSIRASAAEEGAMSVTRLVISLSMGAALAVGCGSSSSSDDSASSSTSPSASAVALATAEPATAAPQRVDPKTLVRELQHRAEAQYEAAAAIVEQTPATEMQAAQLTGEQGGLFYDEDRSLQADIKCSVGSMGPKEVSACEDLAEAEAFEYSAVAAALGTCNEHDARLNLKVARAFLDEVVRDLRGTNREGWSPPDITSDTSDQTKCME